jgi:hypothetical protein
MSIQHYAQVIQQFCELTGLPPWQPEERSHIEVDGITVCCHCDVQHHPSIVQLLMDLGEQTRASLHEFLLMENGNPTLPGDGHFALHPELGTVVYRVALPAAEINSGARFLELIASHLTLARQRLCF